MVGRDTGRSLVFRVQDRQRETLVTRPVHEFIEPGTVITSDKFSPYFNLNDGGYIHLMVNHSENFVEPYTGAHSNTIEGLWNQVKRKLKAMNGTTKAKLPGYLDEFNWRKLHQEANPELICAKLWNYMCKLLPAWSVVVEQYSCKIWSSEIREEESIFHVLFFLCLPNSML